MKNFTQPTSVFGKKSFYKMVSTFVFLLLLLVGVSSFGQTAASATWTFTSAGTATNSGAVTGATAVNGGYGSTSFSSTGYNLLQQTASTWTGFGSGSTTNATFTGVSTTTFYIQLDVSPTSGNNLTVNTISIPVNLSASAVTSQQVAAAYSTDNWSTFTIFSTGGSSGVNLPSTNSTVTLSATSLGKVVNSGGTFSVRIISWRAASSNSASPTVSIGGSNGNCVISGTTVSAGITSAQSGNWSSTSTWVGGVVPSSSANAIIASGHTVTLDVTTGGINTRNSGTTTTVNTGGTLATSVQYINNGTTTINGSFQLNAGGFTNSGNNFVYGSAGKLIFNNTSSYGVNNTDQYWPTTSGPVDVTILQGGMTLNSGANRTVPGVFQTAAAVTLSSATLTLNGTVRINTGGSFANAPTYGSSSTLIYNTGAAFTRGNEWTTATSGAGYPANVQISNPGTVTTLNMGSTSAQCSGNITVDASTILNTTSGGLTVLGSVTTNGTTNTGGALNVSGSVTTNGTISLGGDVTLSGTTSSDWIVGASATQTNNGKAVFFTGATGTQNVIKTGGGTVFFDYLVISKATSGSVVLSSSPATNVTINTTAGNVLQLKGLGSLDLNGNTLALNNSGGGIYVDGARTITSTIAGGKLDINQYKFVGNNAGTGALTIGANVTVNLNTNGNLDFGKSGSTYITTLNGTLSINSTTSCFVNTNPPIYGTGALLKYNSGGTYGRGIEWSTTSGAGFPYDVQVSNSTTLNYPNTGSGAFSTALATARDLTIDALSALYMDYGSSFNKSAPLTIGRNISLAGNLSLGDAVGGDLNVAGNWTRTGVFTPNSRAVTFNGTSAQTMTGVTTFDYLTLNNSTGLTLANSATVNLTLALTSGKITLGTNDLTVGSAGTVTGASTSNYVIAASTGQFKRTVGASNILFPVGNTAYNPITFNNSGTSDVYGVRVVNGAITTGANNTKTVSRSWVTTEAVSGGSNLSVVAQYNTGETNTGFAAATNNFIGFYNGTTWSQVAATHAGANPFTVTSNSNLSPSNLTTGTQYFAIGRDNAFLSIASNFVITAITPTSPTAGSGFSVTVQSQDAYGVVANVVANTAFSLTTNGNAGAISGTTTGTIAAGTNSITVTGVILASAGTGVTVTATRTSGDVMTAATSSTFTVLAAASQLAFVGVPSTGNVGVNLTSFTVEARRPDNSVDNTFTGSITIAKASGTGNLSGTLTATAVAGVATFSAAQFDAASTYTLSATSGSLTSATSGNIVVTLAAVVIAGWDFFTVTSGSPPATFAATTFNSNLVSTSSLSNITRGANASASGANSSFRTLGFANDGISTANTDYFQTTLKTAVGYTLNISAINAIYNGTGTYSASPGVTSQYAYSLDGTNFTLIGSPVTSTTTSSVLSVDTTGVTALQNVPSGTTVYIRYYASGQTATGGWGYFSSASGTNGLAFTGNVLCVQPTAYTVTGGGNGCVTSGVAVGLSNSQVGVSYQLKNGATNVGSAVAGTGSAISFGNQTTAGTYTVVASNTNGSCSYTLNMTGSATVTLDPASVAGSVSGTTAICTGNTTTIGLSGYTGTIQWQQSLNGTSGWANVTGGSGATTDTYTTAALTSTTYYRAIVTSGACSSATSANVTITVNPNNTVSLTSATGTDAQTVCSGAAITNITYATTGATGATVTGLPTGVTGSWSGNVVTISGSPSVTAGSPYTYTVTLTGGCGTITTTGTITVNQNHTITLASGSTTPTICINTALGTNIVYTVGGGATGAGVTGLPSGMSGNFSGSSFTISGTPTVAGTFNYTVTTTGNACTAATATGTITVNPVHTLSLTSGSTTPTLCINTALSTNIVYTFGGGATSAGVTGLPSGMSGAVSGSTFTISGTPTASGTFNYTVTTTGNGCTVATASGTITVTPLLGYANLQFPASASICTTGTLTAYGQVYLAGVTPGAGQGSGISVQFGYNGTNSDPSTWTNWSTATYNTAVTGSNDEYMYTFTPPSSGTYYYTFRYSNGSCGYQYGGYTSSGGGFWDGTTNVSGILTVSPNNTVSAASSTPTLCINTALTAITLTTTGATGIGTASGLPAGVTASFGSNTITISGTPTASGTFSYNIPLTGGCGSVAATGTITVTPDNTVSAASSTPTLCVNTALTAITHTTTGATGIGTASGLPAGVTASFGSNTITISGTPTASGTFSYSIPLAGGCGSVAATGTITVTPNNTVSAASSTPTLCINTALTAITHTTTGATGIGTASGLPAGVTASFGSNTITISGTPTASGTFSYSIPLTGGCGSVAATGTIIVNPSIPASVSIVASATTICAGTSVTFTATPTNGGTAPSYQWKLNGANVGTDSTTYTSTTLADTDSITVVMTSNASPCLTGSPATSNAIDMTVNPNLPASVSIVASATTICTGTAVTFTATPTNGGTPAYQWKINGTDVSGETSSTFTTSTLSNGDDVTVVLTSDASPCLTGSPATSNSITMTVNPSLAASVSITASATSICTGTSVTFTATPTNGGTPTYQWYVNGAPISGETSSTYTTTSLVDSDFVYVVMNSTASPCLTGSPATSNSITITVNPDLSASVSIAASATTICAGTSVTFTATPTNGGTSPTYQWQVNGTDVSGETNATFTSTTLADSDDVTVIMTSNAAPCLIDSPATSNDIVMTVNPSLVASVNIAATATTICVGTSVTFTATPTNGGTTPTYQWQINGTDVSGQTASTFTTSSLTNGDVVTVVMTSNASPCLSGSPATSNAITITVSTTPSASISSNNGPSMCVGGNVIFTISAPVGSTVTYNLNGGANATVTLTSSTVNIIVNGATSTQTLNLVSVSIGTCSALIGTSSTVSLETTTWNGSIWDNGAPTSTTAVVFTGDYTIDADFAACSISLSNNAVVTVNSGKNVTINGAITVATGSTFTLENNANLYQSDPSAVNTGNVVVKRDTNPLIRLDYTLWSSPVSNQQLFAFSPLTTITPTIRFYTYNTTTDLYNSVPSPSSTNFAIGKGYLIRLPYNHPTAATIWHGAFTGVANNGTKTVSLSPAVLASSGPPAVTAVNGYNAVGNPYPSPISIAQFAADNASNIETSLYFWRKTNNALNQSYCTWNTASQTFTSDGEAYASSPNGVIQTGQGFIVKAKVGATSLEFNNGQRVVNNANQFFKNAQTTATSSSNEAHRIWLNLTGSTTEFSQAVVGYFTNATLGADDYDSKFFNDGAVALSMKIGASDYVIQGRPTPFNAADVVPLNYKVTTAGSYTFAIDHVDGLFSSGAQLIYIKDNLDGSYHDITSTPFVFTSAAGTFSDRFELVYQNLLSVNNANFTSNSLVVYHQQNDVVINTGVTTMSTVRIFDIRGRMLMEKKDINASETRINVGTTNQVLLVEVTNIEGVKAIKKVVN